MDAYFKRGKLHGTAKAYDENRKLIMKEFYQDGEISYQSKY